MPVSANIRGNQLDLLIARVLHLVGDGRDLVLQRVRINALDLPVNAGAPFPRRVHELHHGQDLLADERHASAN